MVRAYLGRLGLANEFDRGFPFQFYLRIPCAGIGSTEWRNVRQRALAPRSGQDYRARGMRNVLDKRAMQHGGANVIRPSSSHDMQSTRDIRASRMCVSKMQRYARASVSPAAHRDTTRISRSARRKRRANTARARLRRSRSSERAACNAANAKRHRPFRATAHREKAHCFWQCAQRKCANVRALTRFAATRIEIARLNADNRTSRLG